MGRRDDYQAVIGPAARKKTRREEYDAERPVGLLEGVQQVSSKIGRGAASTVAMGLESAGLMLKATGAKSLGGANLGDIAISYARDVSAIADKYMPQVERLRDSFLLSQAPEAFGSALAFGIGGGWLKAAGVPAWAGTMGLGSLVQSASQYEDARLHGASEEDQWKAWLLGAFVGASEAIPLARILNRADKASGGTLKSMLIHGVIEGGEEFFQETGSTTASNIIAAHLLKYDEDRKVWEGALANGQAGFASALLLSALGSASAHSLSQESAKGETIAEDETDQGLSDVQAGAEGPGGAVLPGVPTGVPAGETEGALPGEPGAAEREAAPPGEAEALGPTEAAVPGVRGGEEPGVPPEAGGAPGVPGAGEAGGAPLPPQGGGEGGAVPVQAAPPGEAPGAAVEAAQAPAVERRRRLPESDAEAEQGLKEIARQIQRHVAGQIDPELLSQADTDPLTGLANRRGDAAQFERVRKVARRKGDRLIRMFGDLDNFKAVNTQFGDAGGDKAIQIVANAWRKAAEEGSGILPARKGGDEFVTTLRVSKDADVDAIRLRMEEIAAQALEEAGMGEAMGKKIAASIGWVEAAEGEDLSELTKRAAVEAKRRKVLRGVSQTSATGERVEQPGPPEEQGKAVAPATVPDAAAPAPETTGPLYAADLAAAEATKPGQQVRGAKFSEEARAWANKRAAALTHGERIEDSTGGIWEVTVQKKGTNAGQKTVSLLDDSGEVVGPIYAVDSLEGLNILARSRAAGEKPAKPAPAPEAAKPKAAQTPEQELDALEQEFQAWGAKIRASRAAQSSPEVKALRASQDKVRNKILTLQNEIEVAKKQGRPPRSLADTLSGVEPQPKAKERFSHYTTPEAALSIRASGWRPKGRSPYRSGDKDFPNWYPEGSLFLSLDPSFWGREQVIRTGDGRRVYSKENNEEFERLAAIKGNPVDYDYQKQSYYVTEGGARIQPLEALEFEVDPKARRVVVSNLRELEALIARAQKRSGSRDLGYANPAFWEALRDDGIDIVEVRNARTLGLRDGPKRSEVGGHWRFWDQMTADQLVILNPSVAVLLPPAQAVSSTGFLAPKKKAKPPEQTPAEKKAGIWGELPRPESLVTGGAADIELANGKTLPAVYGVMEAEQLIPSHDARRDFAPNLAGDLNERQYDDPVEGKPFRETVEKIVRDPKPRVLLSDTPTATDGPPIVTNKGVVLGGNARAMGMQWAYARGILQQIDFAGGVRRTAIERGITIPHKPGGFWRHPVLVRVIADGQEGKPGELSRLLNEALTTAKGATTEAISRGSLITAQAAREIADALGGGTLRDALGDPARAKTILRAMVNSGALTQGDLVELTDPTKGTPTTSGKQVIEDALLGAVILDVRTLSETPPAARAVIIKALPALVRIKAHYPTIARIVTHAAQGMATLKESGQPLADALGQQVLPGVDVGWKSDRLAVAVIRAMVDEAPTKVAAHFSEAADRIEDYAGGQTSLFGDENLPPEQRLAREFGETDAEKTGLVEEDDDIPDEPTDTSISADPGDLPVEMQAGYPADPAMGGGANLGTPIGGRLLGSLKPPPKPGKKVSQPDIIEALAKVVEASGGKTPIRWGRLGTRNARGVFKVGPEVIRVRTANNVATATHEVGHAIEKHILGSKQGGVWKKPLVSTEIQKELVALGKALYGNTKPTGGYKTEGFAEFIRLYTTEPASALAQAPKLHAWFEARFLASRPEVKAAIETVRELATRWREQGSMARAEASMVEPTSLKEKLKRAKAQLTWGNFIETFVEAGRPLNELAREAERRLGVLLDPVNDPFMVFQALRSTHSARMKQMVESGMVNLAGEKVGPPLRNITPLVRGRYQDFMVYLWGRRAIALLTDPKGAREAGLSLQDAEEVVKELGSVEFQRAADMVYEWNEGVLNYAAQASPEFAEIVKKIRERDPGSYITLQREFDVLDSIWGEQKKARGMGGGGSVTKKLKGSGRRIKNPFPAMLAGAERTVLAAHRRMVFDSIFRLSQIEGLGHIIEEVPVDQVPVASIGVEQLLERLRQKAGIPENEGGIELTATGLHEGADLSDLMAETLTFFAPAQFPKGQDPVIPRWRDGQVRWYRVPHKLASMLAGMDVYRLPKVADLILGVPARAMRLGTTGLRASFGLITNPIRDFQVLWQNTRSNAWAPRLFFEWVKQIGVVGLHHATGGKVTGPYLEAFLNLGGEMAQAMGQDRDYTAAAARRLFQGRAIRIVDPRNLLDFARNLLQFPETAARVTELKLLARDIGWQPGQPMNLNQSLQLLLAAKQGTIDFTAAGNFGRVMNQIAPFHNAPIQGARASIRAARKRPGRWMFRGLQMTISTLGLWWLNKDKEWYRELSSRAKATYWSIPFTWNGREELAVIPRAQEGPMLFGSLPEAMADAWYRQDAKGASQFFGVLFDTLAPNVWPVLGEEAYEQRGNRDLFTDAPIVPMGELRRPPDEQVGEYTSDAAIFLGKLFSKIPGAPEAVQSPRRIDHAIRGVFGGVAADVIDTVGLGGPERPGGEPSDALVLGKLFQRGGPIGVRPRSVEDLYDEIEKADRHSASLKVEETPDERYRRLLLEDAGSAVSSLSYVRSQTKDVDQRRELTRKMVALAQAALQDARTGGSRGPAHQARKEAEHMEQELKRR